MEVEPRIVKQYKRHHCCSCKNYREGGKDCEFVRKKKKEKKREKKKMKKKRLGASYSTSNKLLLVSRHILATGLPKCV